MNKFQTFQEFLTMQSIKVPLWGFILNLFLSVIMSSILTYIYIKCGTSLSNRRMFAKNFVLITMTTMLVITIVKSSLALSLGLVGALSILRFRAAIKEPEELSYLFLAIAIGLGFGAGQRMITIIAFIIISGVIISKKGYHTNEDDKNLFLTITGYNPQKDIFERILGILKKYSQTVNLKRFEETKEVIEVLFLVELDNFEQLNKIRSELKKIDESIKINFLDNKGII